MEVTGRIKLINPTQTVSEKFKKRELVVTTEEQYPQNILIEFNQDKCEVLDKYALGDSVIVSINLRGREWVNPQGEAKYFNTIQGWKIEKVGSEAPAPQPIPAVPMSDEDQDDLPF